MAGAFLTGKRRDDDRLRASGHGDDLVIAAKHGRMRPAKCTVYGQGPHPDHWLGHPEPSGNGPALDHIQ